MHKQQEERTEFEESYFLITAKTRILIEENISVSQY